MNNTIVSKISLYDTLSMLVPGSIIIWGISKLCSFCDELFSLDKDNWFYIFLFIVFSYVIGLVYSCVMDYLWQFLGLRNNAIEIKCALIKNKIQPEQRILMNMCNITGNNNIKDVYYEAYTFVQKNTYRNVIDVIENQIAFLRNMLLIIPYMALCFSPYEIISLCPKCRNFFELHLSSLHISHNTFYYLVLFATSFSIILFFAIQEKQKKLYSIVWEDYIYLKRIESKRIDSFN